MLLELLEDDGRAADELALERGGVTLVARRELLGDEVLDAGRAALLELLELLEDVLVLAARATGVNGI